jgi:hypothetical protein
MLKSRAGVAIAPEDEHEHGLTRRSYVFSSVFSYL